MICDTPHNNHSRRARQPDLSARVFLFLLNWQKDRAQKRLRRALAEDQRHDEQGAWASFRRALDRPCFPQRLSQFFLKRVSHIHVPGQKGLLRARLYVPYGRARGCVLFLHGGGFVHCGLNSHHGICCRLARISGCAVLALDYRLAPEHPFPSALEDGWSALLWLSGQLHKHGLKVAVAGDSAGANLAAVLANRAASCGGPELALQLLYYPTTHGVIEVPSHTKYATGYMLTEELLKWYAQHYLRTADDLLNPELAPILNHNLKGAAPAVMLTADFDPLRDEAALYARHLREQGVRVRYRCYEGTIHGFLNFYSFMAKGRKALRDGARAIRHAMR